MDLFEAIHTRRSIRRFENKALSEGDLHKILEAGMSAPSAGNEQPWQFIVIKDKNILAEIPKISPYASMAKDAGAAILVCGDTSLEEYPGFWVQDCSACIQNILLAVHGLGLGAVWTAIYPDEGRVANFKKLFSLPKTVVPLALIPIGYPAQKSGKSDRFKPERIHKDKW